MNSEMTYEPFSAHGLPDPHADRDFYEGVPTRRLLAWLVDAVIIFIVALFGILFMGILTLGVAFFFAGFLAMCVSFIYRVAFLATKSATPGMMLMGIEFRTRNGEKFQLTEALIHTTLFMILFASFIGQVASCITMLTTDYKRSLQDMVLGSTAINKPLL